MQNDMEDGAMTLARAARTNGWLQSASNTRRSAKGGRDDIITFTLCLCGAYNVDSTGKYSKVVSCLYPSQHGKTSRKRVIEPNAAAASYVLILS
jgi:hypothetical protein